MDEDQSKREAIRLGLLALFGAAGGTVLLSLPKSAEAVPAPANAVALIDTAADWINPATEDTLKLVKTQINKLSFDINGNLLTAGGGASTIDNAKWGGVVLSGRDITTDIANLDVLLSTRLKLADYNLAQELGRVGIVLTVGGVVVDPRSIRALTSADIVSTVQSGIWNIGTLTSITNAIDISDRAARLLGVVYGSQAQQLLQRAVSFDLQVQLRSAGVEIDPRDVSDRSTRLAGRHSVSATDGGVAIDPRDVLDRAARLLGIIYGSQSQQLKQTATNFNLQVELATAATLYDARQIRTLTSTDIVTAAQVTAANLNARTDTSGATGSAVLARADQVGGRAATANPTAATGGNLTNVMLDKLGRLVAVLAHVRDLITQGAEVIISTTTETSILVAGGAGVFNDLTKMLISNTSATAVRVDFRDALAGAVRFSRYLAAGQPYDISFVIPWKQTTAAAAWTAQLSVAVTDVRITVQAAQNL